MITQINYHVDGKEAIRTFHKVLGDARFCATLWVGKYAGRTAKLIPDNGEGEIEIFTYNELTEEKFRNVLAAELGAMTVFRGDSKNGQRVARMGMMDAQDAQFWATIENDRIAEFERMCEVHDLAIKGLCRLVQRTVVGFSFSARSLRP